MYERDKFEKRAARHKMHMQHKEEHLLKHEERATIHKWRHDIRHEDKDKKDIQVEAVQVDDDVVTGSSSSAYGTSAAAVVTGLVIGTGAYFMMKRRNHQKDDLKASLIDSQEN